MKQYNARKAYYYFLIYCEWLLLNNIADDSKTISVSDLFDYVETQIPQEDFDLLRMYVTKSI